MWLPADRRDDDPGGRRRSFRHPERDQRGGGHRHGHRCVGRLLRDRASDGKSGAGDLHDEPTSRARRRQLRHRRNWHRRLDRRAEHAGHRQWHRPRRRCHRSVRARGTVERRSLRPDLTHPSARHPFAGRVRPGTRRQCGDPAPRRRTRRRQWSGGQHHDDRRSPTGFSERATGRHRIDSDVVHEPRRHRPPIGGLGDRPGLARRFRRHERCRWTRDRRRRRLVHGRSRGNVEPWSVRCGRADATRRHSPGHTSHLAERNARDRCRRRCLGHRHQCHDRPHRRDRLRHGVCRRNSASRHIHHQRVRSRRHGREFRDHAGFGSWHGVLLGRGD